MLKALYYEEAYLIGRECFVRNPINGRIVRINSPEPITDEEMKAINDCQMMRLERQERKKAQRSRKIEKAKKLLSELEEEL